MVGPAGREQLDPKVMQVLLVLAQHAGNVVTRQELLEKIWPDVVVGDDVVSRCVYQLRRHLRQAGGEERHAALVETLPKRGYRLNCELATAPPSPPEAVAEGTSTDLINAPVRDVAPDAIRLRARNRWLLSTGGAVVLAATVVPHRFHARHDAVARRYLYQISRRRTAFAKP